MKIFERTREHPFSIFDMFMFGFWIGAFGIVFIKVWF